MNNILLLKAKDLVDLMKRISIGKGKDNGYSLYVSAKKKGDKYRATFFCSSDTMQSTSAMPVQWRGTEEVDGKEMQYSEMAKDLNIHIAPVFRTVVNLLAEGGDFIILSYDGIQLTLKNELSTVEVPTMSPPVLMENPKNVKKVTVTIKKAALVNGLPFINAAMGGSAGSVYGNRYGIYPTRIDENAMLHVFATDGFAVSYGNYELIGTSEGYSEACVGLKYAMLPADKLSQIISCANGENLAMTFYYEEDGVTPKQVNIKCGSDNHQILTYIKAIYQNAFKSTLDNAYEEYDCSFQAEARILLNAYNVAAISGSSKSKITVEHSCVNIGSEDGRQSTKLTGLIEMDEAMESVTFLLATEKIMHMLRPFSGKIKINGSDGIIKRRIITLESSETNARLGLCMVTPTQAVPKEEDEEEEEATVEE